MARRRWMAIGSSSQTPKAIGRGRSTRRSMTTFWKLRNSLRDAKPHAGHFALAALVNEAYIKSVITQNIDGLDIKAGIGDALIEIHGNRSRLRCIGCAKRTDLNDFVPLFIPEPCDECGQPVKFDAVMFGEPIVPEVMAAAREQIDLADCVLAIGTSATVRPASGLLWVAKHRSKGNRSVRDATHQDAKLIEINPNPDQAFRFMRCSRSSDCGEKGFPHS